MSDALGPMVYGENEGEVFLGRSVTTHQNMSEETMKRGRHRGAPIIDEQYALARRLLEENRDKVEVMAKALLEWETIDADQIDDIMEGRRRVRRSRCRTADAACGHADAPAGRANRRRGRPDPSERMRRCAGACQQHAPFACAGV